MAKSIKLGADTYLDASGVTLEPTHKTLDQMLTTALGTSLSANVDLNTITTPGRYYVTSPSGGSNFPPVVGTSADIIVIPRAVSTRVWQIYLAYSATTPRVYIRVMSGASAFTEWKEL